MMRFAVSVAFLVTIGFSGNAGAFGSTTVSTTQQSDCREVALQAAAGVPDDDRHIYKLAGPCLLLNIRRVDGDRQNPEEVGRAFMSINAQWNARDNKFQEQAKLEGDTTGSVNTVFKCARDPYLEASFDGTNCTVLSHNNTTSWPELSKLPAQLNYPIGQGNLKIADATEASRHSAENAASPPPPPPPPPAAEKVTPETVNKGDTSQSHIKMRQAETTGPVVAIKPSDAVQRTEVSRSDLSANKAALTALAAPVAAHIQAETIAAKSTGPAASIQNMKGFGDGWQEDKQLFWGARKVGEKLTLPLGDVKAGTYRLRVNFTKAPDFAILQVFINGAPAGDVINLYGLRVTPYGTLDLGTIVLAAGPVSLDLWVVGRDRRSRGYAAGIDAIHLEPSQ